MSGLAFGTVWNSGLYKGSSLLVALKLADYADDDGWCWPSVAQLARMTATAPRQVRRVTGEMAGERALFKEVPLGRGRLNRYKLNLPLLDLTGRVWMAMQDAGAGSTRYDSLAAMTGSAVFRGLDADLREAFFAEKEDAMSPIRARKGDMGVRFPAPKSGRGSPLLDAQKGTSDAQKGDSGVLQNPLGNPVRRARVREGGAEDGFKPLDMDAWRTLRRELRERLGQDLYGRHVAMVRLEDGMLVAPTADAAAGLAHCARAALVKVGVTRIRIGDDEEISL
jgi:hypothetical protein